ncbi:hypothetical protein TH0950_00010 [Helicobacter pylori]
MNLIIKIDLFKSGNYLPLKTKIRGIFYRFKPLKQKSQISLVFGMNALVPLGTIKTL